MTGARLGHVMACAVRYALGRSSSVGADVTVYVRGEWEHIPVGWRQIIISDVFKAISEGRTGMDVDRQVWGELLDWMEAHR